MYSPVVRILMGLAGLVLIYYYFQAGSELAGYITLFGVALIVWGYFKNGTVYLAWRAVKKEQFEKAERILNQVRYPELLKKEQRGFYHFARGLIEANRNNSDAAYRNLSDALKFGVRTENNIAIINLNLAGLDFEQGKINEAKEHIKMARTMKYSPALESELLKMEEKINNTAQQ